MTSFKNTFLSGLVCLLVSGCAVVETQGKIDSVEKTAVQLRDLNLAQATTAVVSRTAKPRKSREEIVLRS